MLISVFYTRSLWNNLLVHVIEPFILLHQKDIKYWCIYFSSTQGEHITLAIMGTDDAVLKKNFLETADNFLTLNLSEKNAIEFPLKGFFKDYPNNSIQFDKSRSLVYSWNNSNQMPQQQAISVSLIKAFENEVIDNESIYTFLIYMQLGIIHSAYPDIREACSVIPNILTSVQRNSIIPDKVAEAELTSLIKIFENNKEVFPGIIKEVWEEDHISQSNWLYDWKISCRKFIKTNFLSGFNSLSTLLCRHLGLNERMAGISSQLIIKTFKQLPELN